MQRLSSKTFQKTNRPEKILQFGEGNFLRAFVDWQVHEMNKKTDFNGSVVVAQPISFGLVDKLNEQDGLYTLYLQGIKDREAVREHEVIDSISRGINPYEDYTALREVGISEELRFVVSNTTEAGIAFDENDKLDDQPQNSFPGKLTALLYHRFQAFNGDKEKGLIMIPCELIDRNGEKLKNVVLQYVRLWNLGDEFVQWLEEANTFCCSLVDRIVPGYPRDTIDEITEELGYEDQLVVVGEQFHLWVIEGPAWVANEFPADKAGLEVKFVEDMTPYRTRKVRILNGAHTAMTPVCYLYGIDTVGESMENEETKQFVHELIYEEIIPTLDLPQSELESFASAVIERFRNPFVKHYLSSISLNSMSKFQTRDLPTLLEYVNRKGELPKKMVFGLSALIEFYKGRRGEEEIKLQDDQHILDFYAELWESYNGSKEGLHEVATKVLGYEKHWGSNLNEVPGLTDLVTEYLSLLEEVGVKQAIKQVL